MIDQDDDNQSKVLHYYARHFILLKMWLLKNCRTFTKVLLSCSAETVTANNCVPHGEYHHAHHMVKPVAETLEGTELVAAAPVRCYIHNLPKNHWESKESKGIVSERKKNISAGSCRNESNQKLQSLWKINNLMLNKDTTRMKNLLISQLQFWWEFFSVDICEKKYRF